MKQIDDNRFQLEDPDEMADRMRPPKPGVGLGSRQMGYSSIDEDRWHGVFGPYCSRCKRCHKGECP